jgi:hypothetical protein
VTTVTDTGSQASQRFKKWLETGCNRGEFSGFLVSELPDGLVEKDAITVKTK